MRTARLCTFQGVRPNFIINPGICPRIAEAAGIGPGWGALEVGPGIGVLTRELAKRAAKVVSIEVDERLPPCWPRQWPVWTISSWSCRMCSR